MPQTTPVPCRTLSCMHHVLSPATRQHVRSARSRDLRGAHGGKETGHVPGTSGYDSGSRRRWWPCHPHHESPAAGAHHLAHHYAPRWAGRRQSLLCHRAVHRGRLPLPLLMILALRLPGLTGLQGLHRWKARPGSRSLACGLRSVSGRRMAPDDLAHARPSGMLSVSPSPVLVATVARRNTTCVRT